jgi:hypothetical protein
MSTGTGLSHLPLLPHTHAFPTLPIPPPRPNSDPRVNAPPSHTTNLPFVSSTLNEHAWRFYLRDYPDPLFVDTLIHIIRHGANLGFSGNKSLSQTCTNLKSAFTSPSTTSALSADIAAQVANGRTYGPFVEPPFPNFRCSPLGAATRKRSTKIRRIHHLSWPDGESVNDGIPDSEASITYDMINRAISDLAASGHGSLMIKLDLESAFRHIPVRPADWHLLGFIWEDKLFHDVVLGFGCRSAPYIFNLFGEALHWIMQRHLPARIRHYLDDFLKIFLPETATESVHHALEWSLALGTQLGLRFQPSKIEGPSTKLEFLGLELDSEAMEVRLPSEKLGYLLELLSSWNSMTTCTQPELEELTGFLQFTSQVIPTSRAFLRGLYDFSAGFTSRFSRRHISKAARRDIDWWRRFAADWNGMRFISPSRETLHIYTDAAGTKGLGGHFGNQWFSARCPRRLRHEHIQVKEMLAVVHAVLCWGEAFTHKHIIFHVDNDAVFRGINKHSIKSVPTMALLKSLISLACRLDFTFSSIWLSSADNAIADAASRFSFTCMFQLAPHLHPKPSSKHLRIGGTNSTPSGPRPLHFTFGMDSLPAPDAPTQPVSANLSTSFVSTASTMRTDLSSLPPRMLSCLGSLTSLDVSNPKPLKPTSLPFVPSTLMPIFPSQPVSLPSSGASFEESRSTTVKRIEKRSNLSHSQSSLPSLRNSLRASYPAILHSMQPVALHSVASSVQGNLPQEKGSTTRVLTSPDRVCSFSLPSKTLPMSSSRFLHRKPTHFERVSPSQSQQPPVAHPAQSRRSKTSLRKFRTACQPPHYSKIRTENPCHTLPSSLPSVLPSRVLV